MCVPSVITIVIGLLQSATIQPPPWITHTEPAYTIQSPKGWTAASDRQKGWVHLMGTQGEDIVVWPVFLPGVTTLDAAGAQSLHMKLAAASPYHANWEPPQLAGTGVLRARGTSQNMVAVSMFLWMSSPRGTAGYFYVASARGEDGFRQKQADLARVLGSFRLTGAPVAGAAPPPPATTAGLRFTRFVDPNEGAFSVEVPAGWKTAGGMFRNGPFITHPAIQTDSPDGRTKVVLGDAQLPTNFREYLPGAPAWMMRPPGTNEMGSIIYPYMTGSTYCRFYIESRVSGFCSDLQISDVKDNAPVDVPPPMAMTPSSRYTVGSLSFTCKEQGEPRKGYCTAKTTQMFQPPAIQSPTNMWRVETLLAYLAPPEDVKQAEAAMARLASSFQINTQWGMGQVRAAGAQSRIIAGATQDIANMAQQSQRYRDAVDDRIAKLRSDATLGVTTVVDPRTGDRMTVDSGSGYYWVNPQGHVVGTNVDTRPNVDFGRLLELPLR